jgi:hypothetical protein
MILDAVSWESGGPMIFLRGLINSRDYLGIWRTKFIQWFKHCFRKGMPAFKMRMPRSIPLELLNNGTRNIPMKLRISFCPHGNHQT